MLAEANRKFQLIQEAYSGNVYIEFYILRVNFLYPEIKKLVGLFSNSYFLYLTVLSDPKKKTMYDVGLYDPEEEVEDEVSDFFFSRFIYFLFYSFYCLTFNLILTDVISFCCNSGLC